jgi:hypothetical protein
VVAADPRSLRCGSRESRWLTIRSVCPGSRRFWAATTRPSPDHGPYRTSATSATPSAAIQSAIQSCGGLARNHKAMETAAAAVRVARTRTIQPLYFRNGASHLGAAEPIFPSSPTIPACAPSLGRSQRTAHHLKVTSIPKDTDRHSCENLVEAGSVLLAEAAHSVQALPQKLHDLWGARELRVAARA